mgnify:CR=1 FL=1
MRRRAAGRGAHPKDVGTTDGPRDHRGHRGHRGTIASSRPGPSAPQPRGRRSAVESGRCRRLPDARGSSGARRLRLAPFLSAGIGYRTRPLGLSRRAPLLAFSLPLLPIARRVAARGCRRYRKSFVPSTSRRAPPCRSSSTPHSCGPLTRAAPSRSRASSSSPRRLATRTAWIWRMGRSTTTR